VTRRLFSILGLVFLLLAAAAAFLVLTPAGARYVVSQVMAMIPGKVTYDSVQGRLVGPVELTGVEYAGVDGSRVRIERIVLDWIPSDLLRASVHIAYLRAAGLSITSAREPTTPRKTIVLPELHLPLPLIVDELSVTGLHIDPGVDIDKISAAASMRGAQIQIAKLSGKGRDWDATLRGELTLTASYPMRISADWKLMPDGFNPQVGGAVLRGDLQSLHVDLNANNGLAVDAELTDVLVKQQWQAKVSATDWTPRSLRMDWPDWRVTGNVSGTGDLNTADTAGKLELVTGELGVLNVDATVHRSGPELRLDQIAVAQISTGGTVQLWGSVTLPDPGPFAYDLKGEWKRIQHAGWHSDSGQIKMSGSRDSARLDLAGDIAHGDPESASHEPVSIHAELTDLKEGLPGIVAQARVPYLKFSDYELGDMEADIHLDMSDRAVSSVSINAASVAVGREKLENIQIQGDGRMSGHAVNVGFRHRLASLTARFEGSVGDAQWRGKLAALDLDAGDTGRWHSDSPAALLVSAREASLDRVCLADATKGKLCAEGRWRNDADWEVVADIESLAMAPLVRAWRGDVDWDGKLSGHMTASGADKLREGHLQLQTDCCAIHLRGAEQEIDTAYREMKLVAELKPGEIKGAFSTVLPEYGLVKGDFHASGPSDTPVVDYSMQGNLDIDLSSLRALQAAVPMLRLENGSAMAHLVAGGRVGSPSFRGEAGIRDGEIRVPAAGATLTEIQVNLRANNTSEITLDSTAKAGAGSLSATGKMHWLPDESWAAEFRINGTGAEAVHLPEAFVSASPDLTVAMTPQSIDINGRLRIDEARITPELAPGSEVVVSPDFVIVDQDGVSASGPARLNVNLGVDLGDKVKFAGYGLEGKLTGAIEIVQVPGKATVANGEIQIENGTYRIYGQSLKVDPGRLVFAGGNIDDPGLDVRATRKVGEVVAGVTVRGTVRVPKVSLYSTPSMPDTEVLSYLVLGKPPGAKGSQGETALLLAAADTLLPGQAAGITSKLQSVLGVETIAVESTRNDRSGTNANEGTALVIGKYLAPKLYISYAAGLADALSAFRARYELSKHWLLQTESSTRGSGGDILFTIEK